jgi:hypothetical protein
LSGQFRPVLGEPDLLWRTFVATDKGEYYAAVIAVHGSTTGAAHLYVWSPDHDLLHRAKTTVTSTALFAVDHRVEVEWDNEITKVLQHAEYRRIEME